jgi:hypothetical protein
MLKVIFLRSNEYWSLVESGSTQYPKGTVLTEVQLKALDTEAERLED